VVVKIARVGHPVPAARCEIPLSFPLNGARARFVRLRQLGSDPFYYWTIAELTVIGF